MSDTETRVKRSPAIQKILQHPAVRGEPEEGQAEQAYEEARVRSRDSYVLEIRLSDGSRRAFSYAYLLETDFDFGEGSDMITLRFNSTNVLVSGQALLGLYEKLLDQRARFIQEGSEGNEASPLQQGPYVERVEIERKAD